VVPRDTLDEEIERLCNQLIGNAPLSIAATRETLRRLASAGEADISDLIRACYGSDDFHRAVTAFLAGTPIEWDGK
jgi:enoyl-CoA hydratase